jgi:multiple sugar transport system permease protein
MAIGQTHPARVSWVALRREGIAIALNILTTVLAIGFLFPFLWTLSCSLKTAMEITAFPPRLLPRVALFGNYVEAWNSIEFGTFFVNSMTVGILSVVGQIVSSLVVAYGFARFRFPGRELLFLVCLSGMMMPVYVTIIPLFMLFNRLHWLDTLKPLIVPSYFGTAFGIFLLRQFIMSIPFELDESALIDGASRFTILTRIILPNCKPAAATLAIFAFMGSWNNFLHPLIFLDSLENFTLPLGLWFLKAYSGDPVLPKDHLLMAGCVITTLPVVVLFAAFQRYYVEGIVMSGIKG